MTLSEAIETIDKYTENINDQIVRLDDVYAPDEYYLAVSTVLPILKCLGCLTKWGSMDTEGDFVPRCDESNFRPCPQQYDEELPFG